MLDEQQIQARMPLWEALSSLWLDTEVTDTELEWIARVMADSGLTIEELWRVYSYEVAPVVFMNVYSVAGQWVGSPRTGSGPKSSATFATVRAARDSGRCFRSLAA